MNSPGTETTGTAPAPPICGVKKRAATLDITTYAVNPWKFVTFTLAVNPGNFGVVPLDRERDRRVAENAEVVAVVSIFPDILAIEHHMLPESLLQSGMEFIAKAGISGVVGLDDAQPRSGFSTIEASEAGKNQILIERRFQRPRIGNAKDGVALLDVVGDAKPRFGLLGVESPLYTSPRMPRLKVQLPFVIVSCT